jgi:hypothetical protein
MSNKKFSKLVIRKGGLTENSYLTRDGTWTHDWLQAARFETCAKAEVAAKRVGVTNYGLFPTGSYPIRRRAR